MELSGVKWEVERRYSDFEYLNNFVLEFFPEEHSKLSMPPKLNIFKSDQEVIDERKKILSNYLVKISKNNEIASTYIFRDFTGMPNKIYPRTITTLSSNSVEKETKIHVLGGQLIFSVYKIENLPQDLLFNMAFSPYNFQPGEKYQFDPNQATSTSTTATSLNISDEMMMVNGGSFPNHIITNDNSSSDKSLWHYSLALSNFKVFTKVLDLVDSDSIQFSLWTEKKKFLGSVNLDLLTLPDDSMVTKRLTLETPNNNNNTNSGPKIHIYTKIQIRLAAQIPTYDLSQYLELAVTHSRMMENDNNEDFRVYEILVQNLGKSWKIHRRYSEFENLDEWVGQFFPREHVLIDFPSGSRSFFQSFGEFINKRLEQLTNYLNRLLQNVDISSSYQFRDFIGLCEPRSRVYSTGRFGQICIRITKVKNIPPGLVDFHFTCFVPNYHIYNGEDYDENNNDIDMMNNEEPLMAKTLSSGWQDSSNIDVTSSFNVIDSNCGLQVGLLFRNYDSNNTNPKRETFGNVIIPIEESENSGDPLEKQEVKKIKMEQGLHTFYIYIQFRFTAQKPLKRPRIKKSELQQQSLSTSSLGELPKTIDTIPISSSNSSSSTTNANIKTRAKSSSTPLEPSKQQKSSTTTTSSSSTSAHQHSHSLQDESTDIHPSSWPSNNNSFIPFSSTNNTSNSNHHHQQHQQPGRPSSLRFENYESANTKHKNLSAVDILQLENEDIKDKLVEFSFRLDSIVKQNKKHNDRLEEKIRELQEENHHIKSLLKHYQSKLEKLTGEENENSTTAATTTTLPTATTEDKHSGTTESTQQKQFIARPVLSFDDDDDVGSTDK
eukprot:TRINITY_DN6145_c0_g1_i9.p1 TRINITY_DN6145_c0_g1~~TRINITY_DN6145_c0_g1_i9.p1  ORF type:complete len:876 (-),score=254.13 TRINITY_DN6145_c0_g1_i9:1224-3716(-)